MNVRESCGGGKRECMQVSQSFETSHVYKSGIVPDRRTETWQASRPHSDGQGHVHKVRDPPGNRQERRSLRQVAAGC